MRLFLALLAVSLLGGCGKGPTPEADALDAFVAAGYDDVTVYKIGMQQLPQRSMPGEVNAVTEPKGPEFHGYPIRGEVVITDPALGRKLAVAVAADMRGDAEAAKCFVPHHALRVRRGTVYFDLVICYSCNQAKVWGASHVGKIVTTSDSSQSALDAVLKSGKP